MKNALLLFVLNCLLIFGSSSILAQKHYYTPGLVVTSEGDTLKGDIFYEGKLRLPSVLKMKIKGDIRSFEPHQLQLVDVFGKTVYYSRLVKYHINPNHLDFIMETENSQNPIWEEKHIFIEALIIGDLSLFRFKDKSDKVHFVVGKADGELTDLVRIRYRKNGKTPLFNKYRGQLIQLMAACPELKVKIKELKFLEGPILKLFHKYYDCVNTKPVYEKPKDKYIWKFGLMAGVASNGYYTADLVRDFAKRGSSVNFHGTGIVELILPWHHGTWSVAGYLGFKTYKTDLQENGSPLSIVKNGRMKYIRHAYAVKAAIVNKEQLKWKINGGFSFGTVINSPVRSRSVESGIFVGTDLYYSNYGLHIIHERTNGHSPFINLATRLRTWYFLVSYTF